MFSGGRERGGLRLVSQEGYLGRSSVWKTWGSGRTPALEAEEKVALARSWNPTCVLEDTEDEIFIGFVYYFLPGAQNSAACLIFPDICFLLYMGKGTGPEASS